MGFRDKFQEAGLGEIITRSPKVRLQNIRSAELEILTVADDDLPIALRFIRPSRTPARRWTLEGAEELLGLLEAAMALAPAGARQTVGTVVGGSMVAGFGSARAYSVHVNRYRSPISVTFGGVTTYDAMRMDLDTANTVIAHLRSAIASVRYDVS